MINFHGGRAAGTPESGAQAARSIAQCGVQSALTYTLSKEEASETVEMSAYSIISTNPRAYLKAQFHGLQPHGKFDKTCHQGQSIASN